jgi:flagellar basal-body rod protein FlgC
MSFFSSAKVTSSGMSVQRQVMDLIAENLANINTIASPNEEVYRRKIPIITTNPRGEFSFSNLLGKTINNGVRISSIERDTSAPIQQYDPSHPMADQNGYIRKPNINQTMEMIRMMDAVRAYEANLAVFNTSKSMAQKTLQIGS